MQVVCEWRSEEAHERDAWRLKLGCRGVRWLYAEWCGTAIVPRVARTCITCPQSPAHPQNLEDFVTLWSEYDDGTGTIDPRNLEELLLRLDPPLGLGPYADNKEVLRWVCTRCREWVVLWLRARCGRYGGAGAVQQGGGQVGTVGCGAESGGERAGLI